MAAIFAGPGFAQTKSEAEIKEAIRQVFAERHPRDTREWWQHLGPGAPKVIMSLYESETEIYRRLRLVQGLGYCLEDPKTAEFLKGIADSSNESALKNAAIRSLGASQGARETEFIAKFLKSGDAQTRFTAAEALKRMGDPKATAILDAHMKEEKAPWISARLEGKTSDVPVKALSPIATSSDRMHPALPGSWKGFWVGPLKAGAGLVSYPASLKLKAEGATALIADLQITRPGIKAQSISLAKAVVKQSRFGSAIPAGALDKTSPESAMDAELKEEAGALLLEVRVPALGARIFLKKE